MVAQCFPRLFLFKLQIFSGCEEGNLAYLQSDTMFITGKVI